MNYIKQLTCFFEQIAVDHDLNPTHISLYMALFQYWNLNRFENPISITRDDVMRVSKIASYATYHKCMKELHLKGYVQYIPSYNPFKGSLVVMNDYTLPQKSAKKIKKTYSIDKSMNEQVLNKQRTSIHTSPEQPLVSSINYINSTNNTNIVNFEEQSKQSKNNPFKNETGLVDNSQEDNSKKKLREKKGTDEKNSIPPNWDRVFEFFISKSSTRLEAEKFFNHFQSNGWKVGGKTAMKDWYAAARNWILNSSNFNKSNYSTNQPKPNHLNITNDKNYAEPL